MAVVVEREREIVETNRIAYDFTSGVAN